IKAMGIQDPVGKTINFWGNEVRILGVAKDFHLESLHEEVKPLFFRLLPSPTDYIMAKIEAGREQETLSKLQDFYGSYNPGFEFDYKFMDENYQAQYISEKRISAISKYFAILATLISCLGLFGLAAFTAERRLKEIGIRKILGSSEFGIIQLLSGEFTKMVLAAICIALPLSYFIVKNWLDNFAYKINLEWWYFLSAGVLALIVALLTVGTQALKAARVNPADCLKDE
ncbi:MAG: ABC transporter permease, partial [Bacteroidota bacterium]|nr:ABC transporter permease [Bacteroidota bacterium]